MKIGSFLSPLTSSLLKYATSALQWTTVCKGIWEMQRKLLWKNMLIFPHSALNICLISLYLSRLGLYSFINWSGWTMTLSMTEQRAVRTWRKSSVNKMFCHFSQSIQIHVIYLNFSVCNVRTSTPSISKFSFNPFQYSLWGAIITYGQDCTYWCLTSDTACGKRNVGPQFWPHNGLRPEVWRNCFRAFHM